MDRVRYRRPTTRHKVLLATVALLAGLMIGGLRVGYTSELRSLEQDRMEQLSVATRSAAALVNANHIRALLDKYPTAGLLVKPTQDAWYYVLHDQLERTASIHRDLPPLLIVRKDERTGGMVQLATSDNAVAWLAPCFAGGTGLADIYHTGGTTNIEQDGITWTALVVPLHGSAGRQEAAVVGRVDLAAAHGTARVSLWRNSAFALALLLVMGLLLHRSVGMWMRREERTHADLRIASERMNDSLVYAGRIQQALVPDTSVYIAHFNDAFVINKPKQLVGGDFHWFHHINEEECLVATADCTGHGVPGAMLAAIACSLLNELVLRHPRSDPAELLGLLNERLITVLHQEGLGRGAGDGSDIALCRVHRGQRTILFAGARRPLYWWHAGQLSIINGDRHPVGGAQHGVQRRFTCHRLAYNEGDRLYLFSDGFVDQLGGPSGKRFMSARLQEVLSAHAALPMADMGRMLEQAFIRWQGEQEQLDDVCMLGIAV